uniref:Uncharacterized protein n=1 Tax=Anguilla anguilla TaxID=7936 RepID=A0A0E9U906_ANGAN
MSTGEDLSSVRELFEKENEAEMGELLVQASKTQCCVSNTQKAGSSLQLKGQYYIWMVSLNE